MRASHNTTITGIRQRGFTLIELLVVMALTALLLTLALKPLVDTFNLTSRAGTLIESQTAARDVMREIRQTLGNAVYVYDNVQQPINLWVNDQRGNLVYQPTRFAIVNYVLPGRQSDQFPGTEEIDPTTGGRINTGDKALNGYALPLLPGRTIGRMFVGLANNNAVGYRGGQTPTNGMPQISYSNSLLNSGTVDNRYLVFRAEAPAFIYDPTVATNPKPYIPNFRLFHTAPNERGVADKRDGALIVNDPNFFYDTSLAGEAGNNPGDPTLWAVPGWKDLNGDTKVNVFENWRAIASPMVLSNKADLIVLERDPNNNTILYDANGLPVVRPLIQFAPSYKANDPGTPGALNNAGNEAPNAAATRFTTQNANWANPFRVIVYLTNDNNIDPFSASPLDVIVADGSTDAQGRLLIGGTTLNPNQPLPPVATLPQVGPLLNPTTGVFDAVNPSQAMSIDSRRGVINFEFASGTVLHQPGPNNTTVPVPAYFDPATVNAERDGTWEARFLDLRSLPAAINGGRTSPLDASRKWFNRVRVVPGSERVVGPDQRPGANYGFPIVYTRVNGANGIIGKNEYKINYEEVVNGSVDLTDPRLRKGYIQFNSLPDTGSINNIPMEGQAGAQAPFESPKNGFYRPNGIPQLRQNRTTGENEPALPIEVTFNFQTNRVKDVVKVDYLTFEQMNIALEMRYYDPRTGVPQNTGLNDKVSVRNLKR